MKEENHLGRLVALLVLTWGICSSFYFLPKQIAGIKLKRVDLLADLRTNTSTWTVDSLALLAEDTLAVDSAALQQLAVEQAGLDSLSLAVRDSLYRALYAVEGADSAGSRIEDYSVGHVGLSHFFAALQQRETLDRPVRIGVMGDSFIEGDIFVADLRAEMQRQFGGRGVGFVPISSVAAPYRPTVKATAEAWKTWSMLTDHSQHYTLSCMLFEAEADDAYIGMEVGSRYPELQAAPRLRFIYENNISAQLALACNDAVDTVRVDLPQTDTLTQYIYRAPAAIQKAELHLSQAKGFKALGYSVESERGVIVDNFSVRGNSGLILEHLDQPRCRQLNQLSPYDLIVLQYGLNVANDSVMQYGWYGRRMEAIIGRIRQCFPTADVLVMGVSDRSTQENGEFVTMPSVLSLLHAQRQMAQRAGLPFWNTFGAMGGVNSMVAYVDKNWASKDYTHLGFGGGRALARKLMEAFMKEKEFYDDAEKQ